ncbi:MAG: hydrogenase expression/formation protein [Gammaproteobacteria bacterium]|nr:hydrogenase expression/formation protein [Gammaproteobacteria bacterium]
MTVLSEIPVSVEATAPCESPTGNTLPILHEVRHALARLGKSAEKSAIDLQAMPLSSAELNDIETFLGHGEVSITIDTFGHTEIRESRFPGVWLVTHFNTEGEVESRFIDVTLIPDIVQAHRDDLAQSESELSELLESLNHESE